MKQFILSCCFCLCILSVTAQQAFHPWVISTNFVSLQEPEAGPSLSVEYKVNKRLGFSVEGTALLFSLYNVWETQQVNDFNHFKGGFRIRPEVRFYMPGKYKFYFSGQFLYKRSTVDEDYIVDKYSYSQLVTVPVTREVSGFTPKIGFQTFIRSGVLFELSAGFGAQYRSYHQKVPTPVDGSRGGTSDWMGFDNYNGWIVDFPLTVRVGYRF
jgi:hypothetical protein